MRFNPEIAVTLLRMIANVPSTAILQTGAQVPLEHIFQPLSESLAKRSCPADFLAHLVLLNNRGWIVPKPEESALLDILQNIHENETVLFWFQVLPEYLLRTGYCLTGEEHSFLAEYSQIYPEEDYKRVLQW